ncbi:hypothetical protein E2562_016969 [Oryza meyeriana var. granulata]|uniref:Apple domain-containing protein n=1 Tax=Oryza meyeriana var. granulata TaxID=110450 RepID=A0A6G1DZQ2_9ORYZ|nr:hypothetical protein E2562_016969 [Oryza meyeriana var. granulata]
MSGSTRIYASGPWNGEVLTGVPDLNPHQDQGYFSFTVVSSPEETYYSYSVLDRSLLWRFIVDGTIGKLQRFWYVEQILGLPDGLMRQLRRLRAVRSQQCSCLPGFEPRSRWQWSLLDWYEGCVRTTNLTCGGGDGFWLVNKMKLPDATNATVHADMTLDQCRRECLSNCRCVAYAAANVSGGVSHGCVIWAVDLLGMREYPGVVQDVFLRLAQSDVDALNAADLRFKSTKPPRCKIWGNLPDGQDIAVKRLATNSGQGLVEFKNEVLLIAKLQHLWGANFGDHQRNEKCRIPPTWAFS